MTLQKQYLQTGSKQQEKAHQAVTFFAITSIYQNIFITENKFHDWKKIIFQNIFYIWELFDRVTIEISCQMDFSQYLPNLFQYIRF